MKDNRFTIILPISAALLLPGAAWLARASQAPTQSVRFTDVTAAAGIHFTHNAGRTGKKWLPETMGSGVALFDADGNGSL
jgi:hypothetical protein